MTPELVAAIIGGIALIVGILAGIVQIVQYLQERVRKTDKKKPAPRQSGAAKESKTDTMPDESPRAPFAPSGSQLWQPWLAPDSAAYKFYSPAPERVPRAVIVMPSRPRPPLKKRQNYTNRPFKYDFAPDDVFTMATIMPYLAAVYGAEQPVGYAPFVTPEEIDKLRFQLSTLITIGSGVSNEVSKKCLADEQLTYKMIGYDIYRDAEPFRVPEIESGVLLNDYGLISKQTSPTNQVTVALAGSHMFGQLAIAFALSDPGFYERVAEHSSLDQCQIVLEAEIQGRWVVDYDIIDIV